MNNKNICNDCNKELKLSISGYYFCENYECLLGSGHENKEYLKLVKSLQNLLID
jgi:hypothetical protein